MTAVHPNAPVALTVRLLPERIGLSLALHPAKVVILQLQLPLRNTHLRPVHLKATPNLSQSSAVQQV